LSNIYEWKPENICEERSITLNILAEDNHMRAKHHFHSCQRYLS
jgi:hypothetical protein